MGDFSLLSKYNSKSGFKSVRIGSDSPVLESELNELQEISDHKMSNFIKHFIGNGLSSLANITYDQETKTLNLRDNFAFIDGYLIEISKLSIQLEEGETAYIQAWEETVTYKDEIKLHGNQQEDTLINNYLLDDRINEETSRRIQVKYDLVKQVDPSKSHIIIGEIKGGKFIFTGKITHNYDDLDGGDFNNTTNKNEIILDGGYF